MSRAHRLPADAAHEFGGIDIDRTKPLDLRVDGRRIDAFAGDTVLTALLASGTDTYGVLSKTPMALTPHFAPLAAQRGGTPLPIDRLPVTDGMNLTTAGHHAFGLRDRHRLGHRIDGVNEAPWLREAPAETRTTDVLVIGGGVAGLAAADAAAQAGHNVILAERRSWLGGDARYFGPVGDEASPAQVTADLTSRVAAHQNVTVLTNAEVFALQGTAARIHLITAGRGSVVAVNASRVVLATGSRQRLPVFGGNRLPGVMSAITAYHLAKRYGVATGRSVAVATQSNYGYRLALRLHDAGVVVKRIVDIRVGPQSRFVDYAKASGLTLAGGQLPISAMPAGNSLDLSFANTGTTATSLSLEADALIVAGPFYPELSLWMLAGGGTQWRDGMLQARGSLDHLTLAGSAAGYRSLSACVASGRNAVAQLFGQPGSPIEDDEIGAPYETPEAPATIGPIVSGLPAFFDSGASLISRADPTIKPLLTRHAEAPSLGDVAASVDLGLISPADAGAVAEERGAPGGDLLETKWVPPSHAHPSAPPAWLHGRFGATSEELHLIVNATRKFERGALVFANTAVREPANAIGVIVREAPEGQPGGIALMSSSALRKTDRFVVETLGGPSPARIRRGP